MDAAMNQAIISALETVAHKGTSLWDDWRLGWPVLTQQAVYRLRLWEQESDAPMLVALMGGASSGKSTVFNNLLGAHLASRITARGHATRGPILAVHQDHRALIERLFADGRLLPGLRRVSADLDDNVSGDPEAVALVFHPIDTLRNLLLFDMPDLTSQAAATEGEVALTLLPWFDRLLVVVDHERWFDRQTVSELRAASARLVQDRLVLFNRTREGTLAPEDRATLRAQADRLGAQDMVVLEFRQGRGFCAFAPGTLDEVTAFLQGTRPTRTGPLLAHVAEAAQCVLTENRERRAGLDQLRDALQAAVARGLPSTRDCMAAQMTPEERAQLTLVSRVFRIRETRQWLSARTRRVQKALKGVPLLGHFVGAAPDAGPAPDDEPDRHATVQGFYESMARRQIHEVHRVTRASTYWHELEQWTGLQPAERGFQWSPALTDEIRDVADRFAEALAQWTDKVEHECQGINPRIHGALGAGVIALAVVLIAVPGPITALSLVSAQGALGAALAELAASTGVGALVGKHMGRLARVIQERLLGSLEFAAVQTAAHRLQGLLTRAGQTLIADVLAEAEAYVMPAQDPLVRALETLCHAGEGTHD
jgi:hypothetical protein